MIALNLTRTELEHLLKAIEIAGRSGWPEDRGEEVRVNSLKRQIEASIATLNKDRWQGFNKS